MASTGRPKHFRPTETGSREKVDLCGAIELIIRNNSSNIINYSFDEGLTIPILPGDREVHRWSYPVNAVLFLTASTGVDLSSMNVLISLTES